jgi:hypothetical protein
MLRGDLLKDLLCAFGPEHLLVVIRRHALSDHIILNFKINLQGMGSTLVLVVNGSTVSALFEVLAELVDRAESVF